MSQGVARLRDEVWWGVGAGGDTTARSAAGMGTGDSESLPALKRLLADRDRLEAAENGARKAGRGLWAGSPPSEGRDATSAAAAAEGGGDGDRAGGGKRSWWVGRALSRLLSIGRRD